MADKEGAPERPVMEMHRHHGDVTGGWLRPAVFGMMDGLVSNFALISGVVGGGGSSSTVVLTGLAGLVAGACSMATGEYTSVASQSEHVRKEIEMEKRELARDPSGEERELIALYRHKGLSTPLATQVAQELAQNPEELWRVHVREEMGVDPDDLPSPWVAAGSSFAAFSVGAIVPVLPYIFGASTLTIALVLSLLALFVSGAVVARLTSVSPWFGGARQMLLGALAAAVTFGAGSLVGAALA
jgi:VIT1/CCC1 family predicted Fe2+/Mn2+ transporter